MKEFLNEFWKKKNQWQLWFRIALIPFLIPFAIVAELGRKSDSFIEFVDDNTPKPK